MLVNIYLWERLYDCMYNLSRKFHLMWSFMGLEEQFRLMSREGGIILYLGWNLLRLGYIQEDTVLFAQAVCYTTS